MAQIPPPGQAPPDIAIAAGGTPDLDEILRRTIRESRALATIGRQINESLDLSQTFAFIARAAGELLGGRGVRVGSIEGENFHLRATHGDVAGRIGDRVPIASTFAAEAIRLRRIVRTDDLRRNAERWPYSADALGSGSGNAIAAPLRAGDRDIGAVMIFGNDSRRFTDHDEETLATLADYATAAIRNAQLFEAEHRERQHAEASVAIIRLGLDAVSVAEGADAILSVLDGLVPSTGKALGIIESAGSPLHYVAARGSASELAGVRVPANSSAAVAALATHTATRFANAREIAHPTVAHRVPAESGAIIPLVTSQGLIGAFGVSDSGQTPLSDTALAELERVAIHIALAVEVLLLGAEERRQRGREQMLAAALATMDQPVFIVATDARIIYANAAAAREFGYDSDELTGLLLAQLVAHQPSVADQASLYSALSDGGVWTTERVQRRKDGSEFPAAVAWSLIADEHGQQVGLVVRVRNLTDDRRVAEQLRQAEKLAALGELVAGVAHEVNNPLTGISAYAQLLLQENLSEDSEESVRMIKRETDRASEVIRDLLSFARKAQPRDAMVNMNDIVQQVLRLRTYAFGSAGIETETVLADDLPMLRGDEQKLQQVILNLIANAEHAMREVTNRRLTITTCPVRDRIVLEISDTGAGMTPEIQEHIFEPFFTTKPEGAGTGLGLSVSYGIVQAHDGSITVRSAPGAGATFSISLPVDRYPAATLAGIPE
ncbi:MAG: ATP-binding protein [Gemmatimonadaceae bacterium]